MGVYQKFAGCGIIYLGFVDVCWCCTVHYCSYILKQSIIQVIHRYIINSLTSIFTRVFFYCAIVVAFILFFCFPCVCQQNVFPFCHPYCILCILRYSTSDFFFFILLYRKSNVNVKNTLQIRSVIYTSGTFDMLL